MPTKKKPADPRAKLTKAQRRAQAPPPDVDEAAFTDVIRRLVTSPPKRDAEPPRR
jgi:hypothetical protein